jgi:hypothetical protein
MEKSGFWDSYVHSCKQLSATSNTVYMNVHDKFVPIPKHRGTLHEDTLSLFYFQSSQSPSYDKLWLAIGDTDHYTNHTSPHLARLHMTTMTTRTM